MSIKKSLLGATFLLSGCKSLELDSLVHPHVTNHIHVSLSDEISKTIQEEKNKELKRLKKVHRFEEQTMKDNHFLLQQEVRKIHEEAEKKSAQNFLTLEEKIIGLVSHLMKEKENDIVDNKNRKGQK